MGNEEESAQQEIISKIIDVAKNNPQELERRFTLDELVLGIQYVDYKLGTDKTLYKSYQAKEKEQDPESDDYAHIQELKSFVVQELQAYFSMAESLETALRHKDYIYGYYTYMPDVSDIIYSEYKKSLQ